MNSRIGLILLASAVVFLRVAGMDYVLWDDNVLILENEILKQPFFEAVKLAFTTFYHGDYMPLTLMSFWFDVAFLKGGAKLQHFENLLLHLLNVYLLWRYFVRLKVREDWSLFVCAVFALHPVQVESVAWVSERKGLLSGALLLAGAHASLSAGALKARAAWKLWIAYALAYSAAFLAKANGILLPFVLFAVERAVDKNETRRLAFKHALVLGLGLLGAIVRVKAYESSIPELMGATWSMERLMAWPGMAFAAIGYYLRLFFWPFGLSIIYPSYAGGASWGGWTALGFLFGVGVLAVAWLKRNFAAMVFGAVALFFLAPVLQIVPRINFVNDRYLYLPLVGMAGLVASLVWVKPVDSRRFRLALSLLAAGMAGLSFARTGVWSSNLALWHDTTLKNPENGIAHNNYAQALQSEGKLAEAVAEYEKVLVYGRKDATDNLAFNNLGIIYSSPQNKEFFDLAKAERLLKEGIERSPRPEESFTLRFNLAHVYLQSRRYADGHRELVQLKQLLVASNNQRYAFLLSKVDQLLAILNGASGR